MAEAGLEPIVETVSVPDLSEGGHEGTLALLDRDEPPTALLLPTDYTALGTTKALAERGLRMPDDISVMSFDNTVLAALPALDITSIDQHAHDLGRAAARLLFERIEGGRTRAVRTILAPSLAVRSSTGPAPLRRARRAPRAAAARASRGR
jgi:LacI family transcriptional regulator